jgi:hypothetical protein
MSRRFLFACFAVLVALAASARAAEARLLRVWPGWRDAESFERIGDYFGGSKTAGRETVLRTQAAAAAGYYFLVRVAATAPVERAEFELDVILSGSPEAKLFRFSAALPAKETVFHLGVTGGDWPGGKDESPLAWKLTLRDESGGVLAEQKSFLWEKPDGLRPSEK